MYPSSLYFQNVGASSGACASTPFGTSSVFFTVAESRAMGCTSDYSKRYLLHVMVTFALSVIVLLVLYWNMFNNRYLLLTNMSTIRTCTCTNQSYFHFHLHLYHLSSSCCCTSKILNSHLIPHLSLFFSIAHRNIPVRIQKCRSWRNGLERSMQYYSDSQVEQFKCFSWTEGESFFVLKIFFINTFIYIILQQ